MQQQQEFSVQRRELEIEDYIDIVRRHKAWIIGPTLAGLVIAVVTAFLWPDTYISQASVKVVPSQIPERFVPSNVNYELTQRVNSMAQTILSRANLTNIISNFGLYPKEIKRVPIEDLIEEMRSKHVRISPVVNTSTGSKGGMFQITFENENRFTAQKVCQDLVSRFLDANVRENTMQTGATTDFLTETLASAKKELDGIESAMTAFRLQNSNVLPEERMNNMTTLHSLETRMSNASAQLSRINQDKLLLEAEARRTQELLNQALSPQTIESQNPVAAPARNERLVSMERDIQAIETQLIILKDRYTPTNPDVKRAEQNLALARRQRDELLKQEEAKKASMPAPNSTTTKKTVVATREAKDLETALSRLKAQMATRDVEGEDLIKEQKSLYAQIKSYESRIQSSPIGEQKYLELMRDYDRAKSNYQDLSKKRSESIVATNVINRKQGETLEMLDPASLPFTPAEPKRWVIILAGGVIGLALGAMLAGARELKDTSLKNLKDVRAYTQLTILGCIPLLENDLVVRRRRRLSLLAWSTACLVGTVVASASVYWYYSTKS
jgi:succinoglycan biosynthesis transport protein ExoP